MSAGSLITAIAVLVGEAIFVGMLLADAELRRHAWPLLVVGFVAGVVAGRVAEWVADFGAAGLSRALDPRVGGRSLVAALAGGWIAVEVVKRALGIRASLGAAAAVALPAGETIGRIGCYLNGCCYGTVSSVPWAIHQHGAWRHPAQLYAAGAAMLALASVLILRPRTTAAGLFRIYVGIAAVERFLLEFVRVRPRGPLGLSLVQWVCLATLVTLTLVAARRWGAARSLEVGPAG
jgi:phosphatidylglycerol:prolipoprotein diacylglycerol transferase